MIKTVNLRMKPEEAFSDQFESNILAKSGFGNAPNAAVKVLKRSIDARKKVVVNVQANVYLNERVDDVSAIEYPHVASEEPVFFVGAGPAGLFAALRLIELGVKPVVIERGKDVRARRRDIAAINKDHVVNPESNYCFGEGGAGTYSDCKLYTRSKKRGDFNRILEIFVNHGAKEDILFDAHPHIGTNKLPKIVQEMRESIIRSGGEVHFNTKVVDVIIDSDAIIGVVLDDGQKLWASATILATGHSARDIFQLLENRKIYPFFLFFLFFFV